MSIAPPLELIPPLLVLAALNLAWSALVWVYKSLGLHQVRALRLQVSDLSRRLAELESSDRPPSRPALKAPRTHPANWRLDLPRTETPPLPLPPLPVLIAVPDLTSRGPVNEAGAEEAARVLARRHAEVWTMADQGVSPGTIAQATGQPIGQVELILGLKRLTETHRHD